uniref:Uncharacterized protein n=1 Tax=Rhizophagus irregularis (strain DAOM 181602 / DAOM 197198 / MUCL 43194) TaxID=747089 RepID=U9U2Z2_RHIID
MAFRIGKKTEERENKGIIKDKRSFALAEKIFVNAVYLKSEVEIIVYTAVKR